METKHNSIHQPYTAYEGEKKAEAWQKAQLFQTFLERAPENKTDLNLHHYCFEINKTNKSDQSQLNNDHHLNEQLAALWNFDTVTSILAHVF